MNLNIFIFKINVFLVSTQPQDNEKVIFEHIYDIVCPQGSNGFMFVLNQSIKTLSLVSNSITQILGYEPSELVNKNLLDIIHQYDHKSIEYSLFENETKVALARFLIKKQTLSEPEEYKSFYLTFHQIFINTLTGYQNYSIVFAKLIDDNPDKNFHGFIRCDLSGKLMVVHPKLADLLGLTNDFIETKYLKDICSLNDAKRIISSEESINIQMELIGSNGQKFNTRSNVSRIINPASKKNQAILIKCEIIHFETSLPDITGIIEGDDLSSIEPTLPSQEDLLGALSSCSDLIDFDNFF